MYEHGFHNIHSPFKHALLRFYTKVAAKLKEKLEQKEEL